MKECCEKVLRAAAKRIEGSCIPAPFCLSKKAMKALTPMVAMVFQARDQVLRGIPKERARLDKDRKARLLQLRKNRADRRESGAGSRARSGPVG